MTPQKIKLTRHDGSNQPPVPLNALVFVQYNDNQEDPFIGGLAKHRVWKDVLAYAAIELVEPAPVIEVGDVVSCGNGSEKYTVIHINGAEAWVQRPCACDIPGVYGTEGRLKFVSDLILVRKGGAV